MNPFRFPLDGCPGFLQSAGTIENTPKKSNYCMGVSGLPKTKTLVEPIRPLHPGTVCRESNSRLFRGRRILIVSQ